MGRRCLNSYHKGKNMEKDKVSIKKIYRSVFGEPLFQKGFVIDKKYGWFMKVVGEDILQFFRLVNDQADMKGKKAFYVQMGIVSLYIKSLDKDELIRNAKRTNAFNQDQNAKDHFRFEYNPIDDDDVLQQMRIALGEAEAFFFPLVDKITNLDAYIEYCKVFKIEALRYASVFQNDALSLVVAENHDDFKKVFQNKLDADKERYLQSEAYERLRFCIIDAIAGERDKVYADKELYSAALEEAKRRKEANLEILREMEVIR